LRPQLKRDPLGSTTRFSERSDFVAVGGHMAGQGSAGNVIAAVCSFFIPGLGQLVQGRLIIAVFQFVLACVLWFFLLGWVIHLWSILDAAKWKPRLEPAS
jgi:TM2 domain-containing membrane protein YozV